MNLSAISRKFSRGPARPYLAPPTVEALEARIAPATLVSPTTVTFTDKNGDAATVTISKPLFTAASVATVFTFDTGSVNGDNSAQQQLELLNIASLGQAARGMNISITAVPVDSSPGVVNVGYINASGIGLGDVTVGGDLGRIAAGNVIVAAQGLHSLTVESLGAQALATQPSGGNLNSMISGGVGSITVNGDIDGASIGIGGGSKGHLGSLLVTGSINGGAAPFSGSVRTQGGITSVEVDGSINGGGGASSGLVGTSGSLGTVVVGGFVIGGGGSFSGAILATKAILSVEIDGSLTGGSGPDSGQVGTASNLGAVTIEGSVTGGGGPLSGAILAAGNITTASIAGGLTGGVGAGSGQIGSGSSIGSVTIAGAMTAGAEIHAHQNIQSVSVNFSNPALTVTPLVIPLDAGSDSPGAGPGILDSSIIADIGSIGSILAGGSGGSTDYALGGATIIAGGNIASIQATETDGGGFAIYQTNVVAGSLGNLTATSGDGTAICAANIHAVQGIGSILAQGVLNSTFRAGAGIGGITVTGYSPEIDAGAGIVNSGFDAGGSIGAIDTVGPISGSVFIAGIDLGTAFGVTGAGTFDNTSAASFGFGSSKSPVASHIGTITVEGIIEQSTFLAGVHGAGGDGTFGTKDDSVAVGSSIGAISASGGLDTVFVESGDIGATNSGAILDTTYISTDSAVSAAGIGPIIAVGNFPGLINLVIAGGQPLLSTVTSAAISNSTFISNAGIGNVSATLDGIRTSGENAGIASSTFQAGHAIGTITVIDNASGSGGVNYGIVNSTFNGGLEGYGGTGDISVALTDPGPDGNSAAIADTKFDASVCSCMGASMGSISAENADTAASAAGILDCVFRVHGNIGPISSTMDSGSPTAAAIEGTTFSAFGSIGDINVYGAVMADSNGPSRFLAGYDIGSDMTFGNEDLSAKSLALQGAQSVGNVTVTGYFESSDIAVSINPGSGYLFGDSVTGTSASNDSNVGAGGSIGYVSIGANVFAAGIPFASDHAASHGIEAANFATTDSPTVSAFGYTGAIPVVLYVDGGSGDVRITNLTQLET